MHDDVAAAAHRRAGLLGQVGPGGGLDDTTSAVATPETYLTALRRAGARGAVLMPDELSEGEADLVLDSFDGLVLIGGGDLDPETYGQQREEEVYGVLARRDGFELPLARAAIARAMPMLAICRGHQVLNVALGGTLEQHLAPADVPHGVPGVAGGSITHSVRVQDGSRLATALGATSADVSSQHHQAVDKLGADLEAVAWAADGVIEGIELTLPDQWVIGSSGTRRTPPAPTRSSSACSRPPSGRSHGARAPAATDPR